MITLTDLRSFMNAVDPEHEVRAEEDYPLAVIHIAPKLAFSRLQRGLLFLIY